MQEVRTRAAVLFNGRVIGFTNTALKNGERACFGRHLTDDGCLVQIGTGKISRAKKWMAMDLPMWQFDEFYVNRGGGGAQ